MLLYSVIWGLSANLGNYVTVLHVAWHQIRFSSDWKLQPLSAFPLQMAALQELWASAVLRIVKPLALMRISSVELPPSLSALLYKS